MKLGALIPQPVVWGFLKPQDEQQKYSVKGEYKKKHVSVP